MNAIAGPILVPLDGSPASETILPYAAALARALHLPVRLVQIIDPNAYELPVHPVGSAPAGSVGTPGRRGFGLAWNQVLDQEIGKARSHMETVAGELRATGVEVEVLAHEGAPGDAILAAAAEVGAGMIAMSTHGRGGLQRMMMGSVTDKVVHNGHLPTLVAHPSAGAEFAGPHWRRVLLPLDGSAQAEAAAVPVAAAVAKALGAPLNLCRIVAPPKVGLTGAPGDLSGAVGLLTEAADEALRQANLYLTQLSARLAAEGVSGDQSVRLGVPEDEVIAMTEPDTLLVMATHGRTGLARMVLGSVADRVMRTSNSAVLLVPRSAAK
jgi:nucleotide-binding universal stress UspA family protein